MAFFFFIKQVSTPNYTAYTPFKMFVGDLGYQRSAGPRWFCHWIFSRPNEEQHRTTQSVAEFHALPYFSISGSFSDEIHLSLLQYKRALEFYFPVLFSFSRASPSVDAYIHEQMTKTALMMKNVGGLPAVRTTHEDGMRVGYRKEGRCASLYLLVNLEMYIFVRTFPYSVSG